MLMLFSGCNRQQPEYLPEYSTSPPHDKPVYIFGVHPLHNPQRLHEVYGPLVDFLNRRIPEVRFELEASRSYDEYDRKLYARRFHLALPNPYETLNAQRHGYRVFARMGDEEEFYGIILVRRDSSIRGVADLKGKTVSFPAPTAIVATMMPLYYCSPISSSTTGMKFRWRWMATRGCGWRGNSSRTWSLWISSCRALMA